MSHNELTQHEHDVQNIREQLKGFFARGVKVKIFRGHSNSTRAPRFQKNKYVDTSRLNRVLEVNAEQQYVLVEPNVQMDELVRATLQHNLVPPVVMEFPGITVGGGIQGGAGESSSFRHGLFHNTCLEYEMVLGNGERVVASPKQNQNLFYGTACSDGTLGILTSAKVRLVPAKPLVHLTYHVVGSFDDAVRGIRNSIETDVQFVDAVLFSRTHGVVMTGNFSEEKDLPVTRFRRARDEWFYLHAKKMGRQQVARTEELVPLTDYLFRYDRGAFWMGKYMFDFQHIPFNRLTRFLFNVQCNTKTLFEMMHSANFSQRYVIQDIAVPEDRASAFLHYAGEELGVYPLWVIPLPAAANERLSFSYLENSPVLSVGIWSGRQPDYATFFKRNRNLETTVSQMGGRKWLYAHQYYTRQEFWEIYDESWYAAVREEYHASKVFPDIYDKTHVEGEYQQSFLRGVWKKISKQVFAPET